MSHLKIENFPNQLEQSIAAREHLFDERHEAAFRLFNGHLEGDPNLVVDLYGTTVVLQNCAEPPGGGDQVVHIAQRVLLERLPWVDSVLLKERNGITEEAKQGYLIYGERPTRKVRESGVWYALDLLMNQDASFYLDTRFVRQWALENLADKDVLNTFAYTGSLGVAATAGGAATVIQTDLNKRFLNVAKESHLLNGFPIDKSHFQTADFFPQIKRLKRAEQSFDCIILDPPFFSTTHRGTVDLAKDTIRLINKLRPLVRDGGQIIAINNALYLSGDAYLQSLIALCEGGFVEIEKLIPVSEDITGYPETIQSPPITDPLPFNHATKIALLRINHA